MVNTAATDLLQQLYTTLATLPANRYWVAYSGGVDSHVLLHAMASLRPKLSATLNAVHVNHGLNPAAKEWAAHAAAVCDALDIPCHLFNIDAQSAKGESPEAAARAGRYHAFSQLIDEGDLLLTAHHQQDQAETLLLQLCRGAGPAGLAAMPFVVSFSRGMLARPLLAVSQALINRYAQEKSLQWVEDPSNQQLDVERNYLRHEVVPKLTVHWPAFAKTAARSAAHCADASALLDELAAEDLKRSSKWEVGHPVPAQLSVIFLQGMMPERRRNLLRFWIKKNELPIVSERILYQIESSLLNARADAAPLVQWAGGDLRRYRGHLYAMPPLAPFDRSMVYPWRWQEKPLELPASLGTLVAHTHKMGGEDESPSGLSFAQCENFPVTVRFRQGGERCRLVGRAHHHALKDLLQQAGVPPWLRDRIPLIFLGDQLAAAVGLFCCAPFHAQKGETKVVFSIH